MSVRHRPWSRIARAAADAATHPSWLLPALLLLLPTLILQLTAATYLRTRLAPAMWTVVVGSVVLIWWTQIATPAVCALVHARRTGAGRPPAARLALLSLAIGTSVTFGLALGVLPGIWLQARYAFAPLSTRAVRASVGQTRPVFLTLLVVAVSTLAASALGQGAVAALAEWMGTITPVAEIEGRTTFELRYLPHAVTSVMAYLCTAAALTIYAVAVSAVYDDVRGVSRTVTSRSSPHGVGVRPRVAQIAALGVVLAFVAAFAYKLQQHIY